MISCRRATQLISEQQERKLTWRERLNLYWHLKMCNGCHRFQKQVQTMRYWMKSFLDH